MSTATVEQVLHLVSSLAGELRAGGDRLQRAQLDDNLERDLGFDSLERAELLRRLEKIFEVQLPPRTLATAQTPRDLLQAVSGGNAALAAPASAGPECSHFAPPTDGQSEELPVEERIGVSVGDVLFAVYAWTLLTMLGLGALAAVVALPRLALRLRQRTSLRTLS